MNLQTAAAWSTPSARDWRSDQSKMTDQELYGTKGRPLSRQVLKSEIGGQRFLSDGQNSHPQRLGWPTPRSASGERSGGHAPTEHFDRWKPQTHRRLLSPLFVEWLMGWPIGWTDYAPVATESFRLWLRTHTALLQMRLAIKHDSNVTADQMSLFPTD